MINHRGKEFFALIERVTAGLKQVYQTKNDVFILTASGTGGLEAAVVNTLSPGDRVLSATCGAVTPSYQARRKPTWSRTG